MAEYLFKVEFHLTPEGEEPIGRTGEPGIPVAAGEVVKDSRGDPARFAHLVGTCGQDCQMNGEHGWGVKDGLIEALEAGGFGTERPPFVGEPEGTPAEFVIPAAPPKRAPKKGEEA